MAELIAFRAGRIAQRITVGEQNDSLRQPGRSRLRDLHDALDGEVLDAYGFDPNEDLLAQILALNLSIAGQEQAGGVVRGPVPQGLANTTRTTWKIEPVHRLPEPYRVKAIVESRSSRTGQRRLLDLAERRAICERKGRVLAKHVVEFQVAEDRSIQQTQQLGERCGLPREAW